MLPVRFEPTISADEWPQTHALYTHIFVSKTSSFLKDLLPVSHNRIVSVAKRSNFHLNVRNETSDHILYWTAYFKHSVLSHEDSFYSDLTLHCGVSEISLINNIKYFSSLKWWRWMMLHRWSDHLLCCFQLTVTHTQTMAVKIQQIKKVKVHDPPQPWFVSKVYTAQFNTPWNTSTTVLSHYCNCVFVSRGREPPRHECTFTYRPSK